MNLSKKYQLKNYVRIFVLLIGVSALLWNCEKEEIIEPTETVEIQKHPKINVKMVTLEHLQQKELLNEKLKNIVTALDINKNILKGNKNNYAQSKISSTDNSFVILTDDILEVTTDSTEAYTFRIETPTDVTSTFENFVIEKVNNEYVFSIIKFVKIEDSEEDFPYTIIRQSVNEEQINLQDFEDILRPEMYYDYASGCYWYTYSSSALTRGDGWRIFWCEDRSGGGAGGDGDPNETGNSTDTHDYDSNQDPDDNSDSGSGQGGGGGTGTNTTDPNTADPIIDPNSPIGVLPSLDEIIMDPDLRKDFPCQSDIIYKTNKNSYSDLGQLIVEVFEGNSENINLLFKSDKDDPISDLAITYPEAIPTTNANGEQELNVTIVFSSTLLNNGTDLAIAKTAIHEQVHALLVYLHETNQLLENSSMAGFDELIDAYIQFKIDNQTYPISKTQHEIMAGLVEDMATALHTDFGSADITYDYCKTLMWGGLMGTDTFKNSFPRYLPDGVTLNPEFIKINNASVSEAENKTIPYVGHPDGNDYTTSPKSTPCSN